ncbi:MAG: hypothetical protein MI892_10830, partial [Desulfobacterales bacterium]|nr:hypothetical protein [Desulfobacterales bacterium]
TSITFFLAILKITFRLAPEHRGKPYTKTGPFILRSGSLFRDDRSAIFICDTPAALANLNESD